MTTFDAIALRISRHAPSEVWLWGSDVETECFVGIRKLADRRHGESIRASLARVVSEFGLTALSWALPPESSITELMYPTIPNVSRLRELTASWASLDDDDSEPLSQPVIQGQAGTGEVIVEQDWTAEALATWGEAPRTL